MNTLVDLLSVKNLCLLLSAITGKAGYFFSLSIFILTPVHFAGTSVMRYPGLRKADITQL